VGNANGEAWLRTKLSRHKNTTDDYTGLKTQNQTVYNASIKNIVNKSRLNIVWKKMEKQHSDY
jgi:hypothetical protein